MNVQSEQVVIDAVEKYLKDRRPGGAILRVLPQGVRHEEEWWYVPIQPSFQPPRRYEYYEALAEVERDLEKLDQLTVLLIPSLPEESV